MESLRLEELSASTALQANSLELLPGQDAFVTPTTYEQADSALDHTKTWSRVIVLGEDVVGFIRAHFDSEHAEPELRSCIWRVTVAASAQGRGVGRFAIEAAKEQAVALDNSTLTVVWSQGEEGPGTFFKKLGFVDTGLTPYGDQIGTLTL
jgi:diamine N-acetyltransferase